MEIYHSFVLNIGENSVYSLGILNFLFSHNVGMGKMSLWYSKYFLQHILIWLSLVRCLGIPKQAFWYWKFYIYMRQYTTCTHAEIRTKMNMSAKKR